MRRTGEQSHGTPHVGPKARTSGRASEAPGAIQSPSRLRAQPARRRLSALWLGMVGVMLAAMVLSACGPDAAQAQAQTNKSKLDTELAHARSDLHLPATLLMPVTSGEAQVAAGAGSWTYNYQNAAQRYAQLYTQLVGIEQSSHELLQQQTQHDIDTFATLLTQRRAQGFGGADAYQAMLDTATQQLSSATTMDDFVTLDGTVTTQLAALRALWPAYQRLQDFKSLLSTVQKAGGDVTLAQRFAAADDQAFSNPTTANYATLSHAIDAQVVQLLADQTAALPYLASSALADMQTRVGMLQQSGDATNAATLQQQHDADAKLLARATQLTDYLSLTQTIHSQTQAMAVPLARAQATHDLATLMSLVAQGQAIKVGGYASDYEYADPTVGYGDAANEVHNAKTLDDYLTADDDVNILVANLRAMLANLNDPTPHNQAHQTDLQLMQQYSITDGKAIVISLREQTARFYDNGQLVYSAPMASGRPQKPSPPGLHYAMYKQTHMVFTSPDPKGSPLWYAPTKINFGILYANYGYFLHDAWWRDRFGPGANLPHFDPAAFNGGSHGCINFQESVMQWIYNWTAIGTPIVVY